MQTRKLSSREIKVSLEAMQKTASDISYTLAKQGIAGITKSALRKAIGCACPVTVTRRIGSAPVYIVTHAEGCLKTRVRARADRSRRGCKTLHRRRPR